MKIQRYSSGATNVGLLESEKASLYSPEEAAAVAGAPYDAMSSVIKTAGDTVAQYQIVKDEMDIADKRKTLEELED